MTQYQVDPDERHYNCTVDAYARKGRLGEAEKIVMSMQKPTPVTWSALMGICIPNLCLPTQVDVEFIKTYREQKGLHHMR